MKLRFFSVPVLDGEAEARELNQFLGAYRIINIEKHLVHHQTAALWAVCVTYHEAADRAPVKKGNIDYKEVLPPEEFAVYAALRDLRKHVADQEAIRIYHIFTNAELAAMVTGRVTTVSGLQEIEGIGPAKIKKYGAAFLELLSQRIPELRSSQGSDNGETGQRPA